MCKFIEKKYFVISVTFLPALVAVTCVIECGNGLWYTPGESGFL